MSRFITTILIAGGALTLSRPAFPISRVGNASIVDPVVGFRAELPTGLRFDRETQNDGVLLKGPPRVITMGLVSSLPLYVAPIAADLPELAKLSPPELKRKLENDEPERSVWEDAKLGLACGFAFKQKDGRADSLLLYWGTGKGLLVSSPAGASARALQEALARNVVVDAEACEWKE